VTEAGPRVLLVTPDFPPSAGGIQLLLDRVARHARRVRFSVITLAHAGAGAHDRAAPFAVQRVRASTGDRRLDLVALNLAAARRLRAAPWDAVLCGHITCAPAAFGSRIPAVQYLHAMEIGARPRLTCVATRRAALSIAVSTHTREIAEAVGAPAERIRVVHNGVDRPTAPPEAHRAGSLIVSIARLEDRYKGLDVLLRALPIVRALVPAAHLVVVGDGSLRPWLEALAESFGVADAVTFAGAVSDAERDVHLGRARVFALPSRLPAGGLGGEGFGIVYLEASARGVPVVAGNVGGARDAVRDGVSGLLVDPDDHLAVAGAIARVLRSDACFETLSAGGVDWASRFGWDDVAARVEDVLLEAIAAS
jgi:phosphatidyl-myo-inositol dimannoside synthase